MENKPTANNHRKKLYYLIPLVAILVVLAYFYFFYSKNKAPKANVAALSQLEEAGTNTNASSIPRKKINSNTSFKLSDEEKADEAYLATLPIRPIEEGAIRVPILLYHHIDEISEDKPAEEKSYYVTPEMFERQMAWLAENSYGVISLERLVNYLKTGKNKPPARSVVITFDDGTRGQYENAFPILKDYGYPATFFVVTNWIEEATNKQKSGYMNWQELREMADSGMEIGSHTKSHANLGAVDGGALEGEILSSEQVLEDKLEKKISTMAYPGGSYNDGAKTLAEESGYLASLSVEKEIDHKKDDLYHLGRMHIDNDVTYFKARIQGKFFK